MSFLGVVDLSNSILALVCVFSAPGCGSSPPPEGTLLDEASTSGADDDDDAESSGGTSDVEGTDGHESTDGSDGTDGDAEDSSGGSDTSDSSGPGTCGDEMPSLSGGLADLDLSVPGEVFALDLTADDYAPRITEGNGCEVVYEQAGGFGGMPGLRVSPPLEYVGRNAQYCGFGSSADLWSGATIDIAQINIRYLLYLGSDYAASIAGGGPKAIIPYAYSSLEPTVERTGSSRPMVFWGSADPSLLPPGHAAIGVTSGTVQSYQEPETDYWPIGNGLDAIYFGPSPDHAGRATMGTPVVGDEWVVIEHEIDLRQDRGNPEGLNRLYVWTTDGVVAGSQLDIPLSWDPGHDFAGRYFGGLDGIGYYWNDPAVDLPDNDVVYSHVAFSANRDPGDPIGPPPGFVGDCD